MYIIFRILLFSFCIVILTTVNAFAYIDPGTGSLLVQILISGVVGMLFYFRRFFAFLISIVRKISKENSSDE